MTFKGLFSEDHPFYPFHVALNVILSTFLAASSSVSTMISSSAIQGDLALSDTQTIWITILYLLGINIIVPTGNWFANQFGAKRVYSLGILLFTLASLLASLANSFEAIAISRFLEGVGGGFIFPIGLSLISSSLPKNQVPFAINLYIGFAFGGGIAIGLWASGHLTQFYSWRDFFLCSVPLGALCCISCWLLRKKNPDVNQSPFDFWGFSFFVLFIFSFLVSLTLGPIRSTPQGWHTPYIIALFMIAALSFILLIYFETKSPSPLFPTALFKNPVFAVSLAAMFLLGMSTFASIQTSAEYMLRGLLYEKFTVGKITAVYGITIGVFSMIANYLCKLFSPFILTFAGLFLLTFSFFYNNELSFLTGYQQVLMILLIRGTGVGLSLGPTTLIALYDIEASLKSSAATVLTFFRQVGATYGTTLLAIFSIRRTIFHTARFAEQVNPQIPGYQLSFEKLLFRFHDAKKAKLAIIENIERQALIQGLNDALLIFGYVTSSVALILAIIVIYRTMQKKIKTKSN